MGLFIQVLFVQVLFCSPPMKKMAKLASCYTDVYKLDIYWFSAPDPLIYKFYKNLSNNRSGAQKQRLNEILWTIWYDEKLSLIKAYCIQAIEHTIFRRCTLLLYSTLTITRSKIYLWQHLWHICFLLFSSIVFSC